MLNNSIVTMICVYIGSLIIELVLTKILEPYIPERKKLISYIKKFFLLPARYILPITVIIVLMTTDGAVDRSFVFSITSGFAVLSISICIDLAFRNTTEIINLYREIQDLYKKSQNEKEGIFDHQKKALEMMKDLADVVAQKKDKKNK